MQQLWKSLKDSHYDGSCSYDFSGYQGYVYVFGVRPCMHIDLNAFLTDLNVGSILGDINIDPAISGGITSEDLSEVAPEFQSQYINKIIKNSTDEYGTKSLNYSYDTTNYEMVIIYKNENYILDDSNNRVNFDNECNLSYSKTPNSLTLNIFSINDISDMQIYILSSIENTLQISVNGSTNVMLFVVQEDKVIYIINANINLPIDLINTLEYNIYIKFNYMTNVDYSGNGNYDGEYFSVKQICKNSYDKIKFVTQIYP